LLIALHCNSQDEEKRDIDMSVVDHILDSLVHYLQKKQKARKRKKKLVKPSKSSRQKSKPKTVKKKISPGKKKISSRAVSKVKRPTASPSVKKKKSPIRPAKNVTKASAKSSSAMRNRLVRPSTGGRAVVKSKKTGVSTPSIKTRIPSNQICIGEITHYFERIQVVVLKMTNAHLRVGDRVHIRGKGINFVQKIHSLQIESMDVKTARNGQLVGLKVDQAVKVGAKVYK